MTESTQEATHISSWAFLFFWFFFFNINSCQKTKITSRLLSEKYTNRKCLFLTSPPVCKPLPHPGELRPFSSLIHCHFMNHMLTGLWRRRCGEGEATREGVDVSQLRGGMNLSQPMTIYSRAVQVLMNKSVRLGGQVKNQNQWSPYFWVCPWTFQG